ncbi:MAG: hypothetical protein WCJ64_06760, partial [Rhodospirillaceae bacterium]
MQPLSTYSAVLTQNNTMINTSLLTTKLSQQLSSGKKATDLADNPDRRTILDLTMSKNDKEAYVKSCTLGQITTSQYTVSLQHIEKTATTALKAVQDLVSSTRGLPSTNNPSDDPVRIQYQNLSQTISTAMKDITISLNEQSSSGGGYLYSGLRNPSGVPTYSLPPVRDLNSLPYFASPSGTAIDPTTAADPTSGASRDPTTATPAPPAADPATNCDPTLTAASATLPTYDSDYGAAAPAAPLPSQLTMAWG